MSWWLGLKAFRPRHIVVVGESMLPGLRPGQHRLVWPFWFTGPKVGDVVLAHDPRNGNLIVKRIASLSGQPVEHYELRGDNPDGSTDSRIFGSLPRRFILGRVLGAR